MAGWVRRLVKVDHARADVGLQVAFEGRTAGRDGSKVASPYKN